MGSNHSPVVLCSLAFAASLALVLCGCAGSGPYRRTFDSRAAPIKDCVSVYADSDKAIRLVASDFSLSDKARNEKLALIQAQVSASSSDKTHESCWTTSHERHEEYDLFYAEFDDAGQPVDRVRGAKFEESELYQIEHSLDTLLRSNPDEGLNIVLFTHGWHGSARATDTYSLEFKGILQDIAFRERSYASSPSGQKPGSTAARPRSHRVVGIEIAWRGDSLLFPKVASVYDRKLAAETVSMGAVHELFAYLNQLYLDNSCNSPNPPQQCDRVHLLTIGHSFGALINFRSLASRIQSGINVDACTRAYGFGDMTILLNPAFESARYRALFNQGLSRHFIQSEYFGDPALRSRNCTQPVSGNAGTIPNVQVPTIVTLQSKGDQATGVFFPVFRRVTTFFAKTLTRQESHDKYSAVGWNDDFQTHTLKIPASQTGNDVCTTSTAAITNAPTPSQTNPSPVESIAETKQGGTLTFCPFISGNVAQSDSAEQASTHYQHMQLEYAPGTTEQLPNYFPFWSVRVDKVIMRDHDDFWNPQIVRLISILFEDAYEQTENIHRTGLQ